MFGSSANPIASHVCGQGPVVAVAVSFKKTLTVITDNRRSDDLVRSPPIRGGQQHKEGAKKERILLALNSHAWTANDSFLHA
jgi:hypothetical protein